MSQEVGVAVRRAALASVAAISLSAGTAPRASAAIVELRITERTPFADGRSFGTAGAYVRLKGVAKGELDPKDAHNKAIVNLDKAPLNARGKVEYETDVYILVPADAAKGSGKLFYEVNNRGRKFVFQRLQDSGAAQAAANDPTSAADVGAQPLLLERGYVVVWSGWDPDAPKTGGGLSIRVPIATDGSRPITKRIREELQFGTRGSDDGSSARLSYPAANRDTAKARLTWRDKEGEARNELKSTDWAFADDRSIKLLPEGTKFKPLRIYELWYEAKEPKVVGVGFAATRDVVSFLRYADKDNAGSANPVAIAGRKGTGITHALGFGISQSGRYLRSHIELGMNEDEAKRRVFDGILTHTAGIGRVFANEAFAEPNRTATQHEDRFYPEAWFPFSYTKSTDPFSRRQGTLLRGGASDPVVIEANTSTEYWQKGASLLHTNPKGERDLAEATKARRFLISGTQHGGTFGSHTSRGPCANPRNPHSASPALRALVVVLDDWATKGVKPPASRVPHVLRKTALRFADLKLPKVPGLVAPQSDNPIGVVEDWVDPPARLAKVYGTVLPAIDSDGNEIDGLRLPDQQVPIATLTGWNAYKGLESELCDRDGSYVPFARTEAERRANGDPRPSMQERHGSRAAYVAKVKAAADALVRDRLLLPADAGAYVKAAEKVEF